MEWFEQLMQAVRVGDSIAVLATALAFALAAASATIAVLGSVVAKIYRDWRADLAAHASKDEQWAERTEDIAKLLAEVATRLEDLGPMVLAILADRRGPPAPR